MWMLKIAATRTIRYAFYVNCSRFHRVHTKQTWHVLSQHITTVSLFVSAWCTIITHSHVVLQNTSLRELQDLTSELIFIFILCGNIIWFVTNHVYKRQIKASFRKFEFFQYLHAEGAIIVIWPDMPNILAINTSQSLCALFLAGVLLLIDVTRSHIYPYISYNITI